MRYYEIEDKLNSEFPAFVGRGVNIRTLGGCPECSLLPKGSKPPEQLQVAALPAKMVSFTSWGFGVISTELLSLFGADATEWLKLGEITDRRGVVVDGYRAFVGVERVFFRGERSSEHHICTTCKALVYTYLPRDSPYVTLSQVVAQRPIYEINSMQLLIREDLRERLEGRTSAFLKFHEIPVCTASVDGLPDELEMWPSAEHLIGYRPNLPKWKSNRTIT